MVQVDRVLVGTVASCVATASGGAIADGRRLPVFVSLVAALLFVVPAASAFTVVAAFPSTGTVAASALGIPAVLVTSVGVEFEWTAYTPLTDANFGGGIDIDIFTVSSATTLTLSMISLVACAVVAVLIIRRSIERRPEPAA